LYVSRQAAYKRALAFHLEGLKTRKFKGINVCSQSVTVCRSRSYS